MAGVRIQPEEIVVAPTPPPDVDVEAWHRSLDTVARWDPSALAPTHFGAIRDRVGDHLEALHGQLDDQAREARDRSRENFVAGLRAEIRAAVRDGETADTYEQAVPADQAYQGLERYWRKRAEREAA